MNMYFDNFKSFLKSFNLNYSVHNNKYKIELKYLKENKMYPPCSHAHLHAIHSPDGTRIYGIESDSTNNKN